MSSAIIDFIEGAHGILNVFTEYGLEQGCRVEYCISRDSSSISEMNLKSSDRTKQSRKRLRALRKGFSDKDIEKEGLAYGPGMCEVLPGP